MQLTDSIQKRKRREYRLQRNAAFTRPDPGFSLYEGRTRGKRQRYTFTDEDDFDSDDMPSRRSGRQSGRDTPAVPTGPTVTASGRQVRSRATGLYGETLHSGQVDDRVSPATGDYDRSDVSEEPHAHGRSTRGGNRNTTNGRPSKHTLNSDDEEDATSWDGGDEEEDEPEQMDIDDEDDAEDDAENSSEDEEPQTLMVTLRYSKNPPPAPASDVPAQSANTGLANGSHAAEVPLAGPGMQRQPVQSAPVPALPPQPAPVAVLNGLPSLPQQPHVPVIAPVQHHAPVVNETAPPKQENGFGHGLPHVAPAMPQIVAAEPPPTHPVSQYPVAKVEALPQEQEPPFPLPTAVPPPMPAPASNWQ